MIYNRYYSTTTIPCRCSSTTYRIPLLVLFVLVFFISSKNMGNSVYSLPKSIIMTRRRHPWFNNVFGFNEPKQYEDIYNYFHIETRDNDEIILHTIPQQNGSNNNTTSRQFYVGKFNTPSIHELKNQLQQLQNVCDANDNINNNTKQQSSSLLSFHHIIGDVGKLHVNNPNAIFQVASQFNCLEMPSPNVTPEHGITDYIYDGTQGPICALSCPAATLYRNYFVNEYGQGGNRGKRINTLNDIDKLLDNKKNKYWRMKNGYALPINNTTMSKLRTKLQSMNNDEINHLQDSLRVGVHWNTSVVNIEDWTLIQNHHVTQVFASALPIGYDYNTPIDDWELFAQLILNSTYEATLAIAAIRQQELQQQSLQNNNSNNNEYNVQQRIKVYLTMVGGGVFANKSIWIINAIQRAIQIYKFYPLDIYLVHYRQYTKEYIETLPIIEN